MTLPATENAAIDPQIDDTRQLATILDVIRWAASRMDEQQVFLGHGTTQYWDEAAWLVLDSLHLPLDLDSAHWQAKLTPSELNLVISLIRRRCLEHIPTAYLLNRAWFMGAPYYVDERVLIPRSPFAALIGDQFAPWFTAEQPPATILDIGTGSGCLALAMAAQFPDATVVGSDVSFDALSVAARNVEDFQQEDRVHLMQSDLLDDLVDADGSPLVFDLIISNPPYVDPEEAYDLPEEYHFEPALGLYAEQSGLALVERMLDTAADHLSAQGRLFVEVGNGKRLIDLHFPQHQLTWLTAAHGLENLEAAIFTIDRPTLAHWRG